MTCLIIQRTPPFSNERSDRAAAAVTMESRTLFLNSITFSPSSSSLLAVALRSIYFRNREFLNRCSVSVSSPTGESSAHFQSLRVLEWDKLCDSVASFAGTSLGREATKTRLWTLDQKYKESLRLLSETNAAVEMHRHGGFSLDFSGINAALVKSAIQRAQRDLPMSGHEAIAVASLLQFADILQLNLRAAIKEDADWHGRFMPLSDVILELIINRTLIRSIQQVLDEDGSVKDSASPLLKRSREQVQMLEKRLHELMDKLMRNDRNESSFLEMSNVNGRWCLKAGMDKLTNLNGLLISSGSGNGNIIEPLAAVPLNDELLRARGLVAKAEEDVLLMLTKKMQMDLEEIKMMLNSIIQMDVINARAKYSLSYGGTCPDLLLLEEKSTMLDAETSLSEHNVSKPSNSTEWALFLPKAYHPLLVQQHRLSLRKAQKDLSSAAAERGRRKMQGGMSNNRESEIDLVALKERVAAIGQAKPVAVDIFISRETKVLVVTGPNTGGKTVCLKAIGLAALMAKSGLYILSAESVRIPWFDSVFADIGDEQSLSQSLSTFSGHLKQISDIRSRSTKQSLVLLDEVGAGTNPLEGAALGMSLLESFADSALLTIATTHHGELKTLKYSAAGFENACMEFDEVNLKPTYKILWGIPGRSNAISIAERLGLPHAIINDARELYGSANAEINELITDMEKYKQEFRDLQRDAQSYLMLARDLHRKLLAAQRRIEEQRVNEKNKMFREISEAAATARSMLHKRVRQFRASQLQPFQSIGVKTSPKSMTANHQQSGDEDSKDLVQRKSTIPSEALKQASLEKKTELPVVGTMIHVPSLGRKATVLKVDCSKKEMVVQAGNMKLKLKLDEFQT